MALYANRFFLKGRTVSGDWKNRNRLGGAAGDLLWPFDPLRDSLFSTNRESICGGEGKVLKSSPRVLPNPSLRSGFRQEAPAALTSRKRLKFESTR